MSEFDPIAGAEGSAHPFADQARPPLPSNRAPVDAKTQQFNNRHGVGQNGAMVDPNPRVWVRIYDHVADDPKRTQELGRPCYRLVPYIEVHSKGVDDFMSYAVTDDHIREYPEAWARYCEYKERIDQGDEPAKMLPAVNAAVWREIQAIELYWIKDLAQAEPIAGLEEAQRQAKEYLRLQKPRMRLVNGELEVAS